MGFGNYDNDDTRIKGATDETLIGNVGDRLKVDANVTAGLSSYTSKYRIDQHTGNDVDLPEDNEAYLTIYSYSGSGYLESFSMEFNSENVKIRLEIDSEQIYELDLDKIHDMTAEDSVNHCSYFWSRDIDRFTFCPKVPIAYSTNVTIQAKANSNNDDREMEEYTVSIVKET